MHACKNRVAEIARLQVVPRFLNSGEFSCRTLLQPLTTAALLVSLAVLGGCGGNAVSPPQPAYDAQAARDTLTVALDAWKAGQVPDLHKRTPPVRFSDDDLTMGAALVSYTIGTEAKFGPHQDVPVELTIRDRQGKSVTKQAIYQVALEPQRAVLRNDP